MFYKHTYMIYSISAEDETKVTIRFWNGKSKRKAVRFCPFCEKLIQQEISTHVLTVHKDSDNVRQILQLPEGAKERKMRLKLLTHEGTYKHNMKVMKRGCGDFYVSQKKRDNLGSQDYTLEDFTACEYCKLFMCKKLVTQHQGTCRMRKYLHPKHEPTEMPKHKPAEMPGLKSREVLGPRPAEDLGSKSVEVLGPKPVEVLGPKPIEMLWSKLVEVPEPKSREIPGPKPIEVVKKKRFNMNPRKSLPGLALLGMYLIKFWSDMFETTV